MRFQSCLCVSSGGPFAAYLEAHIEQGPFLEREGHVIGVVTGIQGKRTFRVIVRGEERRMPERHCGAIGRMPCSPRCGSIDALTAVLHDEDDVVKFTRRQSFDVLPNAPSVVPSAQ